MGNNAKVVWILGAGFSKALGLPLADELFTVRYQKLAEGFLGSWTASPEKVETDVRREIDAIASFVVEADRRFARNERAPKLTAGGLPKPLLRIPPVRQVIGSARAALDGFEYLEPVSRYAEDLAGCERDCVLLCERARELWEIWDRPAAKKAIEAHKAAFSWFRVQGSRGRLHINAADVQRNVDFATNEVRRAAKAMREVYDQGGWSVEDILVSLDKAARKNDLAQRKVWEPVGQGAMTKAPPMPAYAQELLRGATRLIVAQMEFAIPDSDERDDAGFAWKPHVRWAEDLVCAEDTIITFNYDRVVEKAFALADKPEAWQQQLLKLHGCVTYCQSDEDGFREVEVRELHSKLRGFDDFDVRLGLPGESKSRYHTPGEPLADKWDRAKDAISEASAVVFVGYRLPPEDIESMEMIVEAMRARLSELREFPLVHLVLGPGNDHARLVESLLGPFAREVVNEGWYTQQAFMRWTRGELLGES